MRASSSATHSQSVCDAPCARPSASLDVDAHVWINPWANARLGPVFKHLRSPEVCVNGETCEHEIAWYAGRSRSGHRGTSTAEERRLHQTAAGMVDHGTAVQAKWAAQHFADLSEHGPSPALVARTCSLDLELCLSCLLCRTPSTRIMRVVQSLMMLRNEFAVALSLEGALRRSSARRGRALTRSNPVSQRSRRRRSCGHHTESSG